jgi:hypothetical protein
MKEKDKDQEGILPPKDCFLFLTKGSSPSTGYPLLDEITIGSSPDNTICLPEENVSSHHARVILSSGDTFQIGDFAFRFAEADIPEARDQFFDTITIL